MKRLRKEHIGLKLTFSSNEKIEQNFLAAEKKRCAFIKLNHLPSLQSILKARYDSGTGNRSAVFSFCFLLS